MNNRINSIIDSSDKIIKTLISEHSNEDNTIKIENEYIFLFNSLNRFNQLTATYKNTPIDKEISRFILLRPLILDTMLFFLLLKLGENEQWNRFHNILNDCIAEGLDKYFNTLKKSIEIDKLNNEDKNEKLKLFHFDYRYFFEDNSTYKNPKLKKFNFNITPYNILKELETLTQNMNMHYYHTNFMNGFKLDRNAFNTIDPIALTREEKIKEILK